MYYQMNWYNLLKASIIGKKKGGTEVPPDFL